ncbi:MAG: ABC transporter substrate-binding protein [Dehalococcoidia bacterium]
MADQSTYWNRNRVSRRSVLGGAGLGLSALALAACGGGGNNKSSSNASGKAATAPTKAPFVIEATGTPQPAAKAAKPGGSFSFQMPGQPATFDPYTQTSYQASYVNGLVYSKLYTFKAGQPGVAPGDTTQEPDLAAAMPENPDQLTWNVKLKPGVKFHNGRALTSEDIKYAIDRYQNYDKSVHKSFWSLWLDHVETPDATTVVFKAKKPYADAVSIMGNNLGAYISPKEFAETDAAASTMLGSGPYMFTDFQSGSSISFKKNPDYYQKPFPYFDDIKAYIVTDTAKRQADFAAKSVDYTWLFLPPFRDELKKQRPDAKFYETQGIGGYIYMRTDQPPFNDKRVRQAMSMGINRKAIRDAISSGEGVADQAFFVGDPTYARQVKDLGDSAKFWNYDPQAAKQLLAAAGHPTFDSMWSHADVTAYGQEYLDEAAITIQNWKDIGINVKDNSQPYATYISTTYAGKYDGIGHSPRAVPVYPDGISDRFYWSGTTGRARINLSYVNDPILNALLDKEQATFALADRKKVFTDIETLIAEQQYEIYYSTDSRTYFWNPQVQDAQPSSFFPYSYLMRWWFDR